MHLAKMSRIFLKGGRTKVHPGARAVERSPRDTASAILAADLTRLNSGDLLILDASAQKAAKTPFTAVSFP